MAGMAEDAATTLLLEDPTWSLGDRLGKARRRAGLTQADMAVAISERLGRSVSKATVSNWENDVAQPHRFLAVVDAWASITRTRQAWLLGGFREKSGRPEQLELDLWSTARGVVVDLRHPAQRIGAYAIPDRKVS
jgi:transcriptional regulator with XRE-family HTH domain